jgi:hypothetical protein
MTIEAHGAHYDSRGDWRGKPRQRHAGLIDVLNRGIRQFETAYGLVPCFEGCVLDAKGRPFALCVAIKGPRMRAAAAALVVVAALTSNAGRVVSPSSAGNLPEDLQPNHALPSAWSFWEAPTAGGPGLIPRVTYVGTINRGFGMTLECRGSGPSIYVSIDHPDAGLQQLRFDVPIPVSIRVDRTARATAGENVRIAARLTEGYTTTSNRVAVGMALADAARAIGMIEDNADMPGTLLAVEVAGSTGRYSLTGARDTFATFKLACESRKL